MTSVKVEARNEGNYIIIEYGGSTFELGPFTERGLRDILRNSKIIEDQVMDKVFTIIRNSYREITLDVVKRLTSDVKTILNDVTRAIVKFLVGKEPVRKTGFPEKQPIVVKKVLHVVYREALIVWQEGKTVYIDTGDPIRNIKYRNLIVKKDIMGIPVEVPEYESKEKIKIENISWKDVLIEFGLDPEKPFEITGIARIPQYIFYITEDYRVVISRKRLTPGSEVYLKPIISEVELERLFEKIPEYDRKIVFRKIAKMLPYEKELKKDIVSLKKQLVEDGVLYITFEELSDNVVDYYLREDYWSLIVENAFPSNSIDWKIKLIYEGYALPYFSIEYSPHALIVKPTKAGTTTLAEAINKEYDRVTAATLAGGYDPKLGPQVGIVHGQDVMIQISFLETGTPDNPLDRALKYMQQGYTRIGAGLREITSKGTAPLVFTANPLSESQEGPTPQFQNMLSLLMSQANSQALGSRMLIFYLKECKDAREIPNPKFKEAHQIIDGIRNNAKVKRKLRMIWDHPKVIEWLRRREVSEEEKKLEEKALTILESLDNRYRRLKIFLREVLRYHYWRLRALALNGVLLYKLPKIWREKDLDNLIPEILEEAEERYWKLKVLMIESIKNICRDTRYIDKKSYLKGLPEYVRVVVYAVVRYVQEYGDLVEGNIIEKSIEDLKDYIKEKTKASISLIKQRIKKRLTDPLLSEFGISFRIMDNDVKVVVNKKRIEPLTLLAPSELEETLMLKGSK